MEISELLLYKPKTAPTIPTPLSDNKSTESYDDVLAAKRRRKQNLQLEQERIKNFEAEIQECNSTNAVVDYDYNDEVKSDMDVASKIKRSILGFEKAALRNQELRVKFSDTPSRFMDSEVALHDSVQSLRSVAATPEMYPLLVELGVVPSLMGLLSHENTDISVAVVELLQEITDVDTIQETEDESSTVGLLQALLDNQICALLVQNMERLDGKIREESDGIHNSLSIIENLVEFRSEICNEAVASGLLTWLIRRLKVKVPFDANKLYASEILSIVLQTEATNRAALGETPGAFDSLLLQLAYYKRHDPSCAEEAELMENIFDCICSLLMHPPNRQVFLQAEGLQLMNLILKEKRQARSGAIKVLNHTLTGNEGIDNCAKFVDILGLRTIFPFFMKSIRYKKNKGVGGVSVEEHEEHVLGIVVALLKNCKAAQRQRVLNKFIEKDHEKVDRLMELHFKYLEIVRKTDARLERNQAQRQPGLNEDENDEELYLRRLEGGLFNLQLIDYIIVDISASGVPSIKERVLRILSLRNGSVKTIRNIIREFAGNLGSAGDEKASEYEQRTLLQLVDKF